MKLTVHMFQSADGVVQGPGGVDEDRSGGFTRGGWVPPYADEVFGEVVDAWFERAGALLWGRTTFEMMRTFWPEVTDPEDRVATAINTLPKYVASSTLGDPGWAGTTVLSGDVVAAVRELKARPVASSRCTGARPWCTRCTRPGSSTRTGSSRSRWSWGRASACSPRTRRRRGCGS